MENEIISRWMEKTGPDSDVVISSRIRLARNLNSYPFPNSAQRDDLEAVINETAKALDKENQFDLNLIYLTQISDLERKMMIEKHLISPELNKDPESRAVAISKDEISSLMVNEEDHLRLQLLYPGLQLEKAWDNANQVDDFLEKEIDIAFDKNYGYLTTCPTNTGTGLRASVMVHLPALTITGRIKKVISAISQLGLAVRGLYGEGTEAIGNLYQISNQVTLGRSEEEIIADLKEVTAQIIAQERNARKVLLKEQKTNLKDKICRAYGTLKYAHSISANEAMDLISYVKLGIDLDIIDDMSGNILNQLMVMVRPATLQVLNTSELSVEQRDIYRAKMIKERLSGEIN